MAPNRLEFGAQMELAMAAAATHADGDPITVRFGEHPTCRIRDMRKIEFDEPTASASISRAWRLQELDQIHPGLRGRGLQVLLEPTDNLANPVGALGPVYHTWVMLPLEQHSGRERKKIRILCEKNPILLNGSLEMGQILSTFRESVQSPEDVVTCTTESINHSERDVLVGIQQSHQGATWSGWSR